MKSSQKIQEVRIERILKINEGNLILLLIYIGISIHSIPFRFCF